MKNPLHRNHIFQVKNSLKNSPGKILPTRKRQPYPKVGFGVKESSK
jgi:hypothetical protein